MFALSNVRHRYGDRIALAVDDWRVAQGEHWLVIGPSGSGKTTLLHLLAGVLRAQAGTVSVALTELELAGLVATADGLYRAVR